jgi:DNA-binding transcriptional MerR regulator
MRIGELSRRVGVSARTLRHYETLGLLSAERTSNGYRDYSETDVQAVAEIRALVDVGFSLDDTRPFLDCLRSGSELAGSCPASLDAYRAKLAEVDRYLARLTEIRSELRRQLDDAEAAATPKCEFSSVL